MDAQTATAFDTEELEKLKASNLLKDFVRKQNGHWDHAGWESFLSSVRSLGYTLPSHVIGAELEMEKEYYWKVKRGEIVVPENTTMTSRITEVLGETAVASGEEKELERNRDAMCGQQDSPLQSDTPKAPGIPKAPELLNPVKELENAVIAEEKHHSQKRHRRADRTEKITEEETRHEKPAAEDNEWEGVEFASLSREEKIEYLKSHFKKKIGEG